MMVKLKRKKLPSYQYFCVSNDRRLYDDEVAAIIASGDFEAQKYDRGASGTERRLGGARPEESR